MNEQLSMFDGYITPVPQVWECTKTCKRFGENVDYPSWWHGQGRCLLPKENDWERVVLDNRCFFWCKLYEGSEVNDR